MPPSHGPQLIETTRHPGRRRASLPGQLVQHLVGDRVIDLAGPAETRGRRREQHQHRSSSLHGRAAVPQAGHLGVVDRVELLGVLSSMRASASTPAPWMRPRIGPESPRTSSRRRSTAVASRDVDRTVDGPCAPASRMRSQRARNLAVGQDRRNCSLDFTRRRSRRARAPASSLERASSVSARASAGSARAVRGCGPAAPASARDCAERTATALGCDAAAPPVITTTSPGSGTEPSFGAGRAESTSSRVTLPFASDARLQAAPHAVFLDEGGRLRPTASVRAKSNALQQTSGHSIAAVLTRPHKAPAAGSPTGPSGRDRHEPAPSSNVDGAIRPRQLQ